MAVLDFSLESDERTKGEEKDMVSGLGRIWETGCVKEKTGCVKSWHATLAIQSFQFLPHLQPKKQMFSPNIRNWASTFVAQMFQKQKTIEIPKKLAKKMLRM